MEKAAVLRAATREGLTLVRAENATGFKGVCRNEKTSKSKPFQAQLKRGGKRGYLGLYATAEEAALAYARELGPEGSKAAAAVAEPAMTAEQAEAAAAEEGLTLVRADNATARWRRRPSTPPAARR